MREKNSDSNQKLSVLAGTALSSAERNRIDEMKEKLRAIVVKKHYAMFSQQAGETKEQDQPRTPTLARGMAWMMLTSLAVEYVSKSKIGKF